MNLFDNILNKTKSGFNYLATWQFWSDIFDIQQQAKQKQANPIQSFLEESKTNPNMQNNRNAVIQMIQNWEDDSFIQDVIVNKIGYTPWLTLKERVWSSLGQRFQKMEESFATDKTGFEKWLSYTKDVLSSPFDVIWWAIQPVVEPIVKPIIETALVQAWMQAYWSFRESNPRLAQNIEAIAWIWSVVAPFTKTGQAVIKAPWQLVRQWAEATMQWVRKVAPSVVKWAEATVDIATAPFKSIYNTAKRYVATPEEISGIQAAIKPKQRVKNGVVQRSQKQIENEIKLTNALIRWRGEVPQWLDTYALSQKKLLEEMGSEIEKATWQPLFIDATQSAWKIRQLANSKAIQTLDPADTNALLALADRLEQNSWRMSIADAEAMNQYINDVIRSTSTTASEWYKKWLLILVQDLRDWLDNAISNIPWEFKSLKKAYWAVRNVYGDTIARQIVFNRQNLSWLVDSIGAIEWFGNIVSWAWKIVTGNVKEWFVDIGKWMTQNAVGRFIKSKNDPDNIIRSIFRQWGERAKWPNIKPKPLPMLPPPSWKATWARNIRVNQPMEKTPIVNEWQKWARPTTPKKIEAQRLLPAPRVPEWTSLPRTDIVAESMRNTNSKRPTTPPKQETPIVVPKTVKKPAKSIKWDEALMSEARKEQIKKWKIIWEWSDRKVIDLWNWTVIKIPKNERWIMQMDVNYADLSNKWLIPKVIEKWKWYVIFEKIENGWKLIESMMNEIDATNYDKKKILSILNDYWYKIDSLDWITINELLNKNNWGVKNWKPIIVDEWIFNNERIFNKWKNLSEIEQNIKYIKWKQKEFKDFQKSIK